MLRACHVGAAFIHVPRVALLSILVCAFVTHVFLVKTPRLLE
jgi:hypothetical protein